MTSVMTAFAHAPVVRYFLVALILSKFSMAALHFILMGCLKFSWVVAVPLFSRVPVGVLVSWV